MEGRNYTADEQLTLEGQTTTEGQIDIASSEESVGDSERQGAVLVKNP